MQKHLKQQVWQIKQAKGDVTGHMKNESDSGARKFNAYKRMEIGFYIPITRHFQIHGYFNFQPMQAKENPQEQVSIEKSKDCKMTNIHIQPVK